MSTRRISRKTRGGQARHRVDQEYPLATLWAVNLLLNGRLWHALAAWSQRLPDSIFNLLRLPRLDDELTPAYAHKHLLELQEQLIDLGPTHPELMQSNLDQLAELLHLSDAEVSVLALMVYWEQLPGLEEVLGLDMPVAGENRQAVRFAQALGLPMRDVLNVLSYRSRLRQAAILSSVSIFVAKHISLSDGLADAIIYHPRAAELLLHRYSLTGTEAELNLGDFEQLGSLQNTLVCYLRTAMHKGETGVNILLHGEPGTGKTQLTRALAVELEGTLHEIICADPEGLPIKPEKRFAAYRFCQSMLASQHTSLLLFDECEDVFARGESTGRKAWVNRTLEQNPRPALWLCNDLGCMDPAFIRRFDLVIEMPSMTTYQRRNMAEAKLESLPVSAEWLDRIASQNSLQAAHLTTAAKVARVLGATHSDGAEVVLDQVLGGLGDALGLPLVAPAAGAVEASEFDPSLSNAEINLEQLSNGMQKSRMGRLCLYGPPGTGKSEYARHLACELGLPLIIRKASDLLHPFLGMTEKAIASAFGEARARKGVLLIDEVDSLLFSRSMSMHSWEVSQVNELLQQMEHYQGILIMTSNHLQVVDHAALRRFDLKIRFDFLTPGQAQRFFIRALDKQALRLEGGFLKRSFQGMQLTPGDFKAVLRRFEVMGQPVNEIGLMQGLRQENELRNQHAAQSQ